MKRYILFSYCDRDASGGWDDFAGWFDTVESAVSAYQINDSGFDRYHILDTATWKLAKVGD
jgi:hypothetical protein